jgi:DNA-binding transcriptional LysR family regulator
LEVNVRQKAGGPKVSQEVEYQIERLDHLGIVAGVCQQAAIAEWLDKQAGENRRSVSVGKATVAMVLNGLGWSLRQLYLVPQYFANKPIEHLLGEGITADRRERSTVWGARSIGSTNMM